MYSGNLILIADSVSQLRSLFRVYAPITVPHVFTTCP